MTKDASLYHNNPLHGLKLEVLLTELVDFYGWEILAAAMNFNCFKLNPSIKGSAKFFRKTDWAREKLEAFYLYKYKNLPRPSKDQYELPPRDRIVPEHQKPREPITFTLEELAQINAEKSERAAQFVKPGRGDKRPARPRGDKPHDRKPYAGKDMTRATGGKPRSATAPEPRGEVDADNPWAAAKKKFDSKNS